MSDETRKSPHEYEPHAMGDGLRFHIRECNGDYWQVYSVGLDHICDCLTQDVAEMVARALEQVAMNPAGATGIFFDADTTLEKIAADGWTDWSGAGGWYGYERQEDGIPRRQCVPRWVQQLVREAHKRGKAQAKRQMREAFGLEEKS